MPDTPTACDGGEAPAVASSTTHGKGEIVINDNDNERLPHHPIWSTDRPLGARDQALLNTPEARTLADKHPNWGPERIKAQLKRQC